MRSRSAPSAQPLGPLEGPRGPGRPSECASIPSRSAPIRSTASGRSRTVKAWVRDCDRGPPGYPRVRGRLDPRKPPRAKRIAPRRRGMGAQASDAPHGRHRRVECQEDFTCDPWSTPEAPPPRSSPPRPRSPGRAMAIARTRTRARSRRAARQAAKRIAHACACCRSQASRGEGPAGERHAAPPSFPSSPRLRGSSTVTPTGGRRRRAR